MPEGHRFQLVIGSQFDNIELVQVVLNDTLERLGVDGDTCHWVDIAVREAVANAIKHGNIQDPTKKVQIDAEIGSEDLMVRVADEGVGFDPDHLEDPLAPENRLKPNGRGIFYMRSFMDQVDYDARPGGGTVVTMHKRLQKPPAEP